jgi:hypothetical protein
MNVFLSSRFEDAAGQIGEAAAFFGGNDLRCPGLNRILTLIRLHVYLPKYRHRERLRSRDRKNYLSEGL